MMNTSQFTQPVDQGSAINRATPAGELKAQYTRAPQSVRAYIFEALAEGLKQALQGSDINIEFFALYARSYLIRLKRFSVSYPKRIISGNKLKKTNYLHNISNVRIFNNPLKLNLQ